MKRFGAILSLFGLVSFLLTLWDRSLASAGENPAAKEQLAQREVQQCREQMKRIHKGIVRFYDAHKRLPGFLYELVPDYCQLKDLTCPARKTVGNADWARPNLMDEALHDPHLSASTYSYECCDTYVKGTTLSYHAYKSAQREYLDLHGGKGASVPILRCFMHGPTNVINISFDGQLTESEQDWEDRFSKKEQHELEHFLLLPEIRFKLDEPLPTRPASLGPNLLDLASNYNGRIETSWYRRPRVAENRFTQLLRQPAFSERRQFDVRGVIQLRREPGEMLFPLRCNAIKVGQHAARLHFLIGAYGEAKPGERIARFWLNFRDRAPISFDVRYAVDILDWGADPQQPGFELVKDKVAWTSEPVDNGGDAERVRLYDFDRVNPHPEAEILSIDFEVSADEEEIPEAGPALFAITLGP